MICVSWCFRITKCPAGDSSHHLHAGYNTCAQATVASESARRIQLALPKKGPKALKVFKVLHKTMLPRCLLTGYSSTSIQKLMT